MKETSNRKMYYTVVVSRCSLYRIHVYPVDVVSRLILSLSIYSPPLMILKSISSAGRWTLEAVNNKKEFE